jgi:hypothetical protein
MVVVPLVLADASGYDAQRSDQWRPIRFCRTPKSSGVPAESVWLASSFRLV